MQVDTIISNIRLDGHPTLVDVAINRGKIHTIGDTAKLQARQYLDGHQELFIPGLVEPHTHIDKTYSPIPILQPSHQADNKPALVKAIEAMAVYKRERSLDQIYQRAETAIRSAISKGVCYLRSHIDLSGLSDIAVIEQLLLLKAIYRRRIKIEYTAMVNLCSDTGVDLANHALSLGVNAIGGAPALLQRPQLHIDNCFMLAEKFSCDIDLHIDETDNPESGCLEYLADQILARGCNGRVVASHCCALSYKPVFEQRALIDKVAAAGIHIVALPACNLSLIGDGLSSQTRGITPIKDLLSAGVNVCVGSDNVQDPFHPWGNYDPLASANIAGLGAQIRPSDDPNVLFDLISSRAATAMGRSSMGAFVGSDANFSLVDCATLDQAIAEQPLRNRVFFEGNMVLEQTLQQDWKPHNREAAANER